MLFADEARWSSPSKGSRRSPARSPARGRADRRGRSLRDFDLTTRLFRYPLSYLVTGPAFAALPAAVREAILRRLHERSPRRPAARRRT